MTVVGINHVYNIILHVLSCRFFFFNDTATTEIYTLSLHDALPISWERESERAQVHEMQESLGGGWSVNGLDATLRALSRGQVRTLLVHADAAEPGFRCGTSGRLARTERECREEGEPMPVLDIVDDAIEEALRQGVDVNVVYDPDARTAVDGAAGLLRFR